MDHNKNVRSFMRPVKQQAPEQPLAERQMVRVTDVTSPFFSWEGWICNVFQGEDDKQYVQIICAHSGFEFPRLTFATGQIVVRK